MRVMIVMGLFLVACNTSQSWPISTSSEPLNTSGFQNCNPGHQNDVAYDPSSQTLAYCNGNSWVAIQLPQGPIGPQGPQGNTGPQGPQGTMGVCSCSSMPDAGSSCSCPNGTNANGNSITGTCGQTVICGTDGSYYECSSSGQWTSLQESCFADASCPANLPPSCQSGTFINSNCTNACAGNYYGAFACGHCDACGGGLIEGPGDGTNACYCLPNGTGAPNSGCPLDGSIHYYVNGMWE